MRRKRRLLLPSGRGLNLYLKLIRNMLKVSSHTEHAAAAAKNLLTLYPLFYTFIHM